MAQLKDTHFTGNIFGNSDTNYTNIPVISKDNKIPTISFGNASSIYGRIGMSETDGCLMRYSSQGCYCIFDSSGIIPTTNGGTGSCISGPINDRDIIVGCGGKFVKGNLSNLSIGSANKLVAQNLTCTYPKNLFSVVSCCITPVPHLCWMYSHNEQLTEGVGVSIYCLGGTIFVKPLIKIISNCAFNINVRTKICAKSCYNYCFTLIYSSSCFCGNISSNWACMTSDSEVIYNPLTEEKIKICIPQKDMHYENNGWNCIYFLCCEAIGTRQCNFVGSQCNASLESDVTFSGKFIPVE